MSETETVTWTEADEAALQELQARRTAAYRAALAPVVAVLEAIPSIDDAISELRASLGSVSPEARQRIERIIVSMDVDYRALIAEAMPAQIEAAE
jgi:hypothetical protein